MLRTLKLDKKKTNYPIEKWAKWFLWFEGLSPFKIHMLKS